MTDWLLSTLLATSALILLVFVVREPIRRHFGARVTYALWLIPAARLFMPTMTHTVERSVPAAVPLRPLTDPMIRESLWMARVAPPDPSLIDRIGGWPNLLIGLWLSVAAGLFVSRLVAYQRDRRAILASSVEAGRLGSVRIVRSPEVAGPIALGIVDRLIAVPLDFERLYGARERRLVLEHELAHHRSGDLVANLFAFVLLCLQWFNPLAWLAHAAFRFDQEAACDARVLDKVTTADRADYGRAIAKAASGRALLFASALDRRNSLQRRLQSMLRNSSPERRIAGRLLVVTAIAAALPLTAGRAVNYVDVPQAPRPVATPPSAAPAVAPLASAAAVAAQPAAAPRSAAVVQASAAVAAAPAQPAVRGGDDSLTISDDRITIDGVTKRWEDLTPAEKARVRSAVATAREALAKTHIDQARIAQDVDRATANAARAAARLNVGGQVQLDLSRAQAEIQQADTQHLIENPERIKANIAYSMAVLQSIDLKALSRSAQAVDTRKLAATVAAAEQAMRKAQAELDRMQTRIDADRQR